jgi:hypothetical protein
MFALSRKRRLLLDANSTSRRQMPHVPIIGEKDKRSRANYQSGIAPG